MNGTYNAFSYNARAIQIIDEHNASNPLFMYQLVLWHRFLLETNSTAWTTMHVWILTNIFYRINRAFVRVFNFRQLIFSMLNVDVDRKPKRFRSSLYSYCRRRCIVYHNEIRSRQEKVLEKEKGNNRICRDEELFHPFGPVAWDSDIARERFPCRGISTNTQ